MAEFRDRLRAAIARSNKTAKAIYGQIGVSKAIYYNWQSEGGSLPRAENIFPLADALGVEARWLITGEGPMTVDKQVFSQEQTDIADAWPLLPESTRHHVQLLIDDAVVTEIPQLRSSYENASRTDQKRANAILERAQRRIARHKANK